MMCGADSIDDANLLRAGGTPRVFDEVYAPSTVGILLREFTFGHSNQLAAVARAHLIALAQRTALLPGTDERMFLDIDSLLRPVYGHQKQGASFGHAKIAGRALLRKGLSPLITTLSTPTAAPVIAEAWLRGGKTGSGRGAARQLKQAITTARAIDPDATIMARGDSAFGTKKVIGACLDEQVEFSLTLSRNRRVTKAIEAIDDDAFTPVHYPGAVVDPDTGALISDAEVAETTHTLSVRGHGRVTARLVVRRVKRRPLPRRVVPGVAVSPVLHQHHPAHRRGRPHPPQTRHRRDHLRRPDRRAAGAYPVRAVRRELRLAGLRGDRAQPAARRRARSPAASTPSRAVPPCAATWSTCPPASPRPPASRRCTCPRTGHGRSGGKPCGTTSSATVPRSHEQDERHLPRPPAIPGPTPETRGKLVQASGSLMPTPFRTAPIVQKSAPRRHDITDPRIQA